MELEQVPAKTMLSRTKSSAWFGYDYTLNLYRGCCHGCIYCDSRSACYQVEDFDRVRCKKDALPILEKELRSKRLHGVIATGAMSDPYNPFERELCLSRGAAELIARYGFGMAVTTKSSLVVRDIDLFRQIGERAPMLCKLTITTCDDVLCRKIEPHVSVSSARFAAVEALAKAGIFTGVLMTPVLPFLEDTEDNVRGIVRAAADCGAKFVYALFGMTLRQNQRDWYYRKLEQQFPGQGLSARYRQRYGDRYSCQSPRAKQLYALFRQECDRYGLLYRMQDINAAYRGAHLPVQQSFIYYL